MTTYTYNGPGETYYPALALTVNPGDTADLPANPGDGWWTPPDPDPVPAEPPAPVEVADPAPSPDDPNPVPITPQTKTTATTAARAKGGSSDAQAV